MMPLLLLMLALSCSALATQAAATDTLSGEAIYRARCAACHDGGALGAPKIGDVKAWKGRIAEGRRAMVRLAIKGIRKMPPRGGHADLSDRDVERAVIHLLNASGGNFKE